MASPTADFLRKMHADFPTYHDPDGISRSSLMDAAGLKPHEFGYPATVLLDGEGVIRGFWLGYEPSLEHEIEAAVRHELTR